MGYFSIIMFEQHYAKLKFGLAIFWGYMLEILSWMIMMPLHVKQTSLMRFYKRKNSNRLAKTLCSSNDTWQT